jgi:hypothetical protein
MKKSITSFLLASMLLIGIHAFAQSSNNSFMASTSNPVTTLVENEGIKVSYMQGFIGSSKAFSFIFENTIHVAANFSWTLKDKQGNVVYSSPSIHLEEGQSLYEGNDPQHTNVKFSFIPDKGLSVNDYKLDIIFKQ